MIGHYLLSLTEEQEDRLLTLRFGPDSAHLMSRTTAMSMYNNANCLIGVAEQRGLNWAFACSPRMAGVAARFDCLCAKFGTERIVGAIRNRILSNRVRRLLSQPVPAAMVQEVGVS